MDWNLTYETLWPIVQAVLAPYAGVIQLVLGIVVGFLILRLVLSLGGRA